MLEYGVLELQNVLEVSFGANTLGSNVWVAILFRRHPYICSTIVLYDMNRALHFRNS